MSARTIQLWVESGALKAWKTAGGHRRIPRSAIADLLEQQQSGLKERPASRIFKILVVEDEPDLLNVYQAHIESWELNCQLLTATDGYQGMLQIGLNQPDLIISDLVIPGMDGFRMIRALRDYEETKGCQIVVVTSLDSEQIKNHGGLPAEVLVLSKPIPFDVIKGLLMGRISARKTS